MSRTHRHKYLPLSGTSRGVINYLALWQNQMNRNENVEMDTRKNRKRSSRGRVVLKGRGTP